MWVYQRNHDGDIWLYTVGYYTPNGDWCPDSDHATREAAAERVHYLNGGIDRTVEKKLSIAGIALTVIANSDRSASKDEIVPLMPTELRAIAKKALDGIRAIQ